MDEWLPIVDEKGLVKGRALRSTCHNYSFLLHPVVHLHLFNSKGELCLQKRAATKDIQPDKWDTAVGGHIGECETIEDALKREWELKKYTHKKKEELIIIYNRNRRKKL